MEDTHELKHILDGSLDSSRLMVGFHGLIMGVIFLCNLHHIWSGINLKDLVYEYD